MFSAPPIPRPTQTIRSALSRFDALLAGRRDGLDERGPQVVELGRRRELRALAAAPAPAGSSVSAAELTANTAGRGVRTVAWSCPP